MKQGATLTHLTSRDQLAHHLEQQMKSFLQHPTIRQTNVFPKKQLLVYTFGRPIRVTFDDTKKTFVEQLRDFRSTATEILHNKGYDWTNPPVSFQTKNISEKTTSEGKIFLKVFLLWDRALKLYFLLRSSREYMKVVLVQYLNTHRKRGSKSVTAEPGNREFESYIFNTLFPSEKKIGRPSPKIIQWTIFQLRNIGLKDRDIAEILNVLHPTKTDFTPKAIKDSYHRNKNKDYLADCRSSLPIEHLIQKLVYPS